jgi:uncharacterized protein YebE (UPF0316 family)
MMLPLLVFIAEICVVTIGTIRIIFVSRGMKVLAPILGFFEVTLWLFAITQIMTKMTDPATPMVIKCSCFLAFVTGFSVGTYLGILIDEKLAMGTTLVRIITPKNPEELVRNLTLADFGVTCLEGQGATGPVQVVLTVVKRKEIDRVTSLIKQFDPKVFYSIGEVQSVSEGIFPLPRARPGLVPNPFKILRADQESLG